MSTAKPQVVPAPPSLTKALLAGFDAIANHVGLILFSVLLDLLLWWGPHIKMEGLIAAFLDQAGRLPEASAPEMTGMLEGSRELWLLIASRFNLLSTLRTFPVGIPSLMAGRSPLEMPWGPPPVLEIPSWGSGFLLWLGLLLAGLAAGTLYFAVIAQAAVSGRVVWRRAIAGWPRAVLQVLLLAVFWLALILVISIPFICMLTFLLVIGIGLSRFAVLVFGAFLIWLLVPLVFSPHGIFVYQMTVWSSIKEGVRLTRMTLPSTTLFFLLVLVLSEGLDVLWQVPPENSWLSLIGVIGHAFVTAGLLAASFVYYRDANRWLQRMLDQSRLAAMVKT